MTGLDRINDLIDRTRHETGDTAALRDELAAIVGLVEGSHTTFQVGARVVEYLGVGGPRLGVRGPAHARVAPCGRTGA